MSIASISPSRPTSAGGRVPAPGLYGLRTASIVRSIGFFSIYRNIAINVKNARPMNARQFFKRVRQVLTKQLRVTFRAERWMPSHPNGPREMLNVSSRRTELVVLGVVTPDERSSTRCRIANQLLTKSHEPVRTDLDGSDKIQQNKDSCGLQRTLSDARLRVLGPSAVMRPRSRSASRPGAEQKPLGRRSG